MSPFFLAAAAGLLVAAIVATFGYASGKRAVQRRINDAAAGYFVSLDDLIASSVAEGKFKASGNAREILSRSGALKERLEAMLNTLDTSFDELAGLASVQQAPGSEADRPGELFAALTALQSSWPGQRRALESETRRLLGLLGIE